jgi:hypothetical protein
MKSNMKFAALLVIMATGCSHNVLPVKTPLPATVSMAPLPVPSVMDTAMTTRPEAMIRVGSTSASALRALEAPLVHEEKCGSEVSIHVGKLDVDIPKGGSLEIAGVKGSTKAYRVILEDVTFTNVDHCLIGK